MRNFFFSFLFVMVFVMCRMFVNNVELRATSIINKYDIK